MYWNFPQFASMSGIKIDWTLTCDVLKREKLHTEINGMVHWTLTCDVLKRKDGTDTQGDIWTEP